MSRYRPVSAVSEYEEYKQIIEILDIDPRTNELITNEVFRWRQATDEITYSGKSYILEEIMETHGWDEERIRRDLIQRQEVLEWMRQREIRGLPCGE